MAHVLATIGQRITAPLAPGELAVTPACVMPNTQHHPSATAQTEMADDMIVQEGVTTNAPGVAAAAVRFPAVVATRWCAPNTPHHPLATAPGGGDPSVLDANYPPN